MGEQDFRVFVQARMSSTRFPGKVLAPFKGKPIIDHVVSRIAQAVPSDRITVATSTERSDDPLAVYLVGLGVSVFRGPLDDVLRRFQLCQEKFPCRWMVRVSADSPLLDSKLFAQVLPHVERDDLDIVTNVFPRTFPKGNSLEMLKAATFAKIDSTGLRPELREHVTRMAYEEPSKFRILNIESEDGDRSHISLCVDTVDDLQRLDAISDRQAVAQGVSE